jgi:hypothetical protein
MAEGRCDKQRLKLLDSVRLSLLSHAPSYLASSMALAAHAHSTDTGVLRAIIQFSNSDTTDTSSTQLSVNRTHVTGYIYWVVLSFRQVPRANARKLNLSIRLAASTYLPSNPSPNAFLRSTAEGDTFNRTPINAGGYTLNRRGRWHHQLTQALCKCSMYQHLCILSVWGFYKHPCSHNLFFSCTCLYRRVFLKNLHPRCSRYQYTPVVPKVCSAYPQGSATSSQGSRGNIPVMATLKSIYFFK